MRSTWPRRRGVEVTLTDHDVERFDVTQAPDANINLPLEQRRPGGLGLHLIRRLVDSMTYEYSNEERRSRITFCKTTAGGKGPGTIAETGGGNAGD
jgi:anti-sigma regulatory factor (Ser/Thr protein kinase)